MKRTMWIVLAVLLVTGGPLWAQADENLDTARGKVVLTWDEFVKITGYDPVKGSQKLTIPWTEVRKLLGDKAPQLNGETTIKLSWEQFRNLIEWSLKQGDDPQEAPVPADYIVASSTYKGMLSEDSAQFTLTVKLNVLRKKGWKHIPILPGNVALTKATLPKGAYLQSRNGSYTLLTDQSGEMTVTLEFAVAVQEGAGINSVSFSRPLPGSSSLELSIDRQNVDVKVAGAQTLVSKDQGKSTSVMAAIPSGTAVGVSWERSLPKIAEAPTKIFAETRTLVAVAEGMLVCNETVYYNILHKAVRELKLKVPGAASVLTVSGSNVQDWQVGKDNELLVVLRRDALGSYALQITFEQTSMETAPVIRPMDVARDRGYVGVVALTNVEISAGDAEGAAAIDVRRLPSDISAMTGQPVLLGFRYVGGDFTVPLNVKRHKEVGVLVTLVDSGLFTTMQLRDGRRITKALYAVRNNRNQFLRMQMPSGAEIWSVTVQGKPVSPARDEEGNVLIPLVRSQSGSADLASFPVEMVYVETPAKQAPSSGTLEVTLPTVTVPVMHAMMSYYLPPEGKYGTGGGLFSEPKPAFSGTLHLVDEFTSLSAGPRAEVIAANAEAQANRMQQEYDQQVAQRAKAAGAEPIRVKLPLNGKQFKLEKILALPGDKLTVRVNYSNWKADE